MNLYLRYISFVLAIVLALGLFSCAGIGSDETTAKETTEKADNEDTTKAEDTTAPEPETFTVPFRYEKGEKVLWEYKYSPDGLSLSKTDYREESPITYTVTFDESGAPLYTEWVVNVNDTRSELWRDEYVLDDEGRIVEERRYCEGDIQNAYSYTYDAEGRMETQQSRNVKQQNTLYRLLYDENGTYTGARYKKYNGEAGNYTEIKTYTYDKDGRITKEETASYKVYHDYTVKEGFVTLEKITNENGDNEWSYYYSYTYENGKLVKKDCSFSGVLTDSEHFGETEFEHYKYAIDWIFRERLP